MQVYGELDHLVCRNGLAFVLRMRQTGIRQVEGGIQFLGGHQRERWIHHHILAVGLLNHALGMHLVGFFLQMAHVLSLSLLVVKALLMTVQDDVILLESARNVLFFAVESNLWHFVNLVHGLAFGEGVGKFHDRAFAHAVENEVGTRIAEDTLAQLILPVVVVADTAQRSLNTA